VPALRVILRASPFLLGAVAAAIWLRRGHVERPQLEPPKQASGPATPSTGRFQREPIDIVTVVDDLLVPGGP
jgi:hypothetical protein